MEFMYFFRDFRNVDRAGAVMRLDGGSEEKGDLERHDLNHPGGDIFALNRRY
jgi:hypothetical protein